MDNELKRNLELIKNKGALVNGVPTSGTFNNTTDSLEQVSDNIGQQSATATSDDLSDITTTDLQAKIRRILLRMSGAGIFSSTIQGAARTELDTMLEQMATYFVAAGAAMSLQVNNNTARTNLQQILNDMNTLWGADGTNVFDPTIQGAARTNLDTALNILASYLTAAGAAMNIQVNNNTARDNLEQAFEDFTSVFGANGTNVFNPTIQGAGQTDLDAALAQLAIYFAAAGAAMSVQVNGGATRASLELILEDYFAVVGCDGANVFSPTIQGAARTTVEAAFDGLAAYFVAAGGALSVTIDPGGAARTTLATLWNDLGAMLAGSGITTFPAGVAAGDGVSIAEVIRYIQNNLISQGTTDFNATAKTSIQTANANALSATAYTRQAGVTQIFTKNITSAANAGAVTVATITTQPCLIKSIVVRSNGATTADLTNISIKGGASTVVTFIDTVTGVRANIAAADQQVSWYGAATFAATKTIVITLTGTGATAVDLQVDTEYEAIVSGGYLA